MQSDILYDFHHSLTLTKALVYSLTFWNKFIMHNVMNVRGEKKNHLRMLFTSEQTYLPVFELGKPPKNLCVFKCYFWHIESFCSIFIKFKAECEADSVFVQVCNFLFMPEFQMDEHRLGISTRPYSEITCAKAQKGSDSAHFTVSLPSNGILCYKHLCHLAVSLETMWSHHSIMGCNL